jgi:hypothetical protein
LSQYYQVLGAVLGSAVHHGYGEPVELMVLLVALDSGSAVTQIQGIFVAKPTSLQHCLGFLHCWHVFAV